MKQYRARKKVGFPKGFVIEGESWKVAPNGRFSVSNIGRCFSHISGRLVGTRPGGSGYFSVSIGEGTKSEYLHRLVWTFFVRPVPPGSQVNHIDGNKLNNRLSNLEVITASENALHARRVLKVGGNAPGKPIPNFHNRKLSVSDVEEIRRLADEGLKTGALAKRYGVHPCSIRRIVTGKTWLTVASEY